MCFFARVAKQPNHFYTCMRRHMTEQNNVRCTALVTRAQKSIHFLQDKFFT